MSPEACGALGLACRACGPSDQCVSGVCTAIAGCNAATCPDGCCSQSGCLTGGSVEACGRWGGVCIACAPGQSCLEGACTLAPDAGADGGTGGGPGADAGAADAGECGPSSCAGCCSPAGSGGVCRLGTSDAHCGAGGLPCAACNGSLGQSCVGQSCSGGGGDAGSSCNAGNCSTGCCSGSGAAAICLLGNTSANCGTGGATCQTCNTAVGQTCTQQACSGGGGDGGVGFGSPCSQDGDCASLGIGYRCKLVTNPGGVAYPGGYCTRLCTFATDPVCGSGAFCVGLIASYGEDDRFCWKKCSSTTDCRAPGYECYTVGANHGCWLDPAPTLDAGPAADKVGSPCGTDNDCQNPPADGFCIRQVVDGGATGYDQGYCSAPCTSDAHCGDGGVCMTFGVGGGEIDLCQATCSGEGSGQGSCRANYVCEGLMFSLADGGYAPAGFGYCTPNCNNPGAGCAQCNDAGYCF